mmetsp:Transcript_27566/g.42988  ORF Transcript_27566/g.42988 Transcript_27566/m.42988 type:complete len:972 (+) Transcript_27566:69-2984(+)
MESFALSAETELEELPPEVALEPVGCSQAYPCNDNAWTSSVAKESVVAAVEVVFSKFLSSVSERKICAVTVEGVLATLEGVISTMKAVAREADFPEFEDDLPAAVAVGKGPELLSGGLTQRFSCSTIEKALVSEFASMQQCLLGSHYRTLQLVSQMSEEQNTQAELAEASQGGGKEEIAQAKWRSATTTPSTIASPLFSEQSDDADIFICELPTASVPPLEENDTNTRPLLAEALSSFEDPPAPEGEPVMLHAIVHDPEDEQVDIRDASRRLLPGAVSENVCESPDDNNRRYFDTSNQSTMDSFLTQSDPPRRPISSKDRKVSFHVGPSSSVDNLSDHGEDIRTEASDGERYQYNAKKILQRMKTNLYSRRDDSRFQVHDCWQRYSRIQRPVTYGSRPSRDGALMPNRPWADENENDQNMDEKLLMLHFDRTQACVIHPNSFKRATWDFFGMLFVVYDMVVLPMALLPLDPPAALKAFDWTTRIFWTLDMPISFLTGVIQNDGTFEMRAGKIAYRYIRTWFGLDVVIVTTDWLEVILETSGAMSYARVGKSSRIFRLIRLIRLMRLIRMTEVLKLFLERLQTEAIIIVADCAKILVSILFVSHMIACCWYGIAESGQDRNWLGEHGEYSGHIGVDVGYRYLSALHWALQQFSGGTDEVIPQNGFERVYAIFIWLMAYVVAGVFVSRLTSSMTRLQMLGNKQNQQLASLRKYLGQVGISRRLALRVQRNAQHALREQSRHLPEEKVGLLEMVSGPLRVELHFEMYSPLLRVHPFFDHYTYECPQVMRKVCHTAATTAVFSPGDVIFHAGECLSEPKMYIVMDGALQYTPIWGDISRVEKDTWLGEASLWTHWVHRGTLKAESFCRLCTLDAKQFQELVVSFDHPEFDPRVYATAFVEELNNMEEGHTDLPVTVSAGVVGIGYGKQASCEMLQTQKTTTRHKIAAMLHIGQHGHTNKPIPHRGSHRRISLSGR